MLLKVCKFGRNNEGGGADDSRIYICISALKNINNCNYSANRKWEGMGGVALFLFRQLVASQTKQSKSV